MNKWVILNILLVLCLIGSWFYFLSIPQPEPEIIIEERVDTVKIEKPVPTYVYLKEFYFYDIPKDSLIYIHNTDTVQVPIPIEEKTFTDDSTYLCTISGFRPSLDYIETYQKTTTITNTIIKRPIISIGPAISVGYDPWRKQFSNSIGVSIIIPVYSIYR